VPPRLPQEAPTRKRALAIASVGSHKRGVREHPDLLERKEWINYPGGDSPRAGCLAIASSHPLADRPGHNAFCVVLLVPFLRPSSVLMYSFPSTARTPAPAPAHTFTSPPPFPPLPTVGVNHRARAQVVIGAQRYMIPVGAEVCRTAEWEVGHRAEGRARRGRRRVERTPATKDADARVQEGAVQRGVEDLSAVRIPTRGRVEKQRRRAIRAPQGQHYRRQKVQQKGEEVDKELRTRNTAVSSPAAKAKTQVN
jgi:hypothetical protein